MGSAHPCPNTPPPSPTRPERRYESGARVADWSAVWRNSLTHYIYGGRHNTRHTTHHAASTGTSLPTSLTHSHTLNYKFAFFGSLLSIVIHCFSIHILLHQITYDKTHLNKNNPCKSHLQNFVSNSWTQTVLFIIFLLKLALQTFD